MLIQGNAFDIVICQMAAILSSLECVTSLRLSDTYNVTVSINEVIIASDNGLSPIRRQAIILNNAGLLLIGSLGAIFSEILIKIHQLSFKKMHFKNVVCKTAAILSPISMCSGLHCIQVFTCGQFLLCMWLSHAPMVPFMNSALHNHSNMVKHCISCLRSHSNQSGTKPNLVAKILATNVGIFFCNIPKNL